MLQKNAIFLGFAKSKERLMSKYIEIKKPTNEDLENLNVKSWPIWTKEKSVFDWQYDTDETCYIIEGQVVVTTEDGEQVEINKGDLVTFKKGLKCTWNVKSPIRKYYTFG